jgi:hypothetical protein
MTAAARPVPLPLPGPYSPTEAITRLLTVAASQIGYREGISGGAYNNDNIYGVWYGTNYVSWCAQYVSWCANVAGYLDVIIPKHQYTPSGWNWFVARNQDATAPRRGDIMYVYGPVQGEKNPRVHHVGFVENVSGSTLTTVEGNTNLTGSSSGNGVYRLTRTNSSRYRFARPNYAAVVKPRPAPPKGQAANPPATGISTGAMIYSAKHPSMSGVWGAQRDLAMLALKRLGMTPATRPPAGTKWDAYFRAAWKKWQLSLGYRGTDADGIPGDASVDKLAKRMGFKHLAK